MQMKKYKLGDIATVEISGVDKKITDGEKEIRLCNFVDVYYNWAITIAQHDSFMLATARPNEISKFQLKKGQVALTKDSETRDDIGISTYIADDFEDVILGYHCALISPNKDILDGRYLNALLHTNYAKKYFACNASGSGQRYALSVEALNSFPVPIIPLHEQKQIGEIFSALDKKIELNRQINQNLEAMAKQLYDYWFVQFDFPNKDGRPYKSSGGKMVWNKKIKREIPEGWKEVTLNDFIDKNKGGDWGYDTPKDGTIKVGCVRGADIIKLNDVPTRHITSKHSDRLLEDGDIVIEISGGSPVQATGRVALITNGVIERNGGALVCSNFCQSFNMKKREFSEYFYYLWQNLYDNDNMFNFEGKTSGIKNFQTDVFLANYWFEVPEPLIETFHTIVAQYHLMIDQNIIENNNLIKQRDKLLPLLMNGQVSVNSDLSVYKKKRRGRIPSLTLNQVSDIQILHRQSIVLLTKQVLMDELQSERLIILVIIPFGTEIFVPIAWHVLLEETSQVFQAFGLVLLEVAAHDDDAPVGEVASSVAVLPEADVAVQITLTDIHAKAVGILHHATTVSVAELLTQVEIEIKNQIFLFHN